MPSTVVHAALVGVIATALLSDDFDTRAILLIMGLAALIDLDTLVGMVFPGTHRAAFHNLWIILLPAALLVWDVRVREQSAVLTRWGPAGYRVAWVGLVSILIGHILLDAFFNGINLFWPLHDRFYDLSGQLYVSNHEGVVQTFVEFDRSPSGEVGVGDGTARGTTESTHYTTGFDPTREPDPVDVERKFPIAYSGERFVVAVAGYVAVGYRIWEDRRSS